MASLSYTIELTKEQLAVLSETIQSASTSSKEKLRANVLLLSNAKDGRSISVSDIAKELGTSRQTVTKIRNIYHEQGFDVALHELKHNRTLDAKCYDDELVAHVKEILSQQPTPPKKRWSIRTLCDECIAHGYVDYIAPMTMQKLLRKNSIEL